MFKLACFLAKMRVKATLFDCQILFPFNVFILPFGVYLIFFLDFSFSASGLTKSLGFGLFTLRIEKSTDGVQKLLPQNIAPRHTE